MIGAKGQMKKNKILLLEDNPIHLEVMVDGLEDLGYEVQKAQNIEVAMKILNEFTPDLFLVDIVIETIKSAGIQFAQTVRNKREYRSIPIIFISAHLDDVNITKYFPTGSDESRLLKFYYILAKPFDFDQLVNKIREVIKS
jgi:CheY-like chemotaxis protein